MLANATSIFWIALLAMTALSISTFITATLWPLYGNTSGWLSVLSRDGLEDLVEDGRAVWTESVNPRFHSGSYGE
jgi:hypothetical protein